MEEQGQNKKGAWKMLTEIHQNTAVILRYLVQLGDIIKDLKPSQPVCNTAKAPAAKHPEYGNNHNAVFSVGIIAPIPSFSDMQLAKCAKAGYSVQDLAILSGYNTAYIYDHVRMYFQKYPSKR